MTDNKITLWGDFTDAGDRDVVVHERDTPHGLFRAVVERDDYPDAPDYDMGYPVFRVARNYYGGSTLDDRPEIGEDSWRRDGIDIHEAWERMAELAYDRRYTDTVDLVDRYLRIFHGGGARIISSTIHQGGDDYLVYDTRAMREHWGQTGERLETSAPSAEEWQAYIDNEVYVIWVERADGFDEDGEPISWTEVGDGPMSGYYGDDYAAEAAIGELESVIEWTAANMLPLEA